MQQVVSAVIAREAVGVEVEDVCGGGYMRAI